MVKKKRLKELDISNKLAYTLMIILVIALLGIGVYAYNLPPPTNVGHTLNEVMPSCTGIVTSTQSTGAWTCISGSIPSCTGSTQGITWTGSAWQCKSLS